MQRTDAEPHGHGRERLDATFAALADPTRRAVVDLLRRSPRRAGELSGSLSASAPAMSRHLRVLRRCGLVEEEHGGEDARVRVYRLRPEPFSALRGWLDEVEAFWGGQLSAFKARAERPPEGGAGRGGDGGGAALRSGASKRARRRRRS